MAALAGTALLLLTGNSLAAPAPPAPAVTGSGIVDVSFTGLRSQKGMVRACLTRNPRFFPHCERDPDSLKQSVAAAANPRMRFAGVASGDYALTVLHDENQNFKADMVLGMPREGFGFSENPRIGFGPPKFAAARFRVDAGEVAKRVIMQYLF